MKKLLICDCDGVLVDSETLSCRLDAEELQARGFTNLNQEEVIRRFAGVAEADMILSIERETGRSVGDDFGEVVSRRLEDEIRKTLQSLPEAAEVLSLLSLPKCVASSSTPAKLQLSLRVTKLDHYFGDNIFSATSVKRGKPAPDLFLYAAHRMNVSPNDCCVIEDSVAGVTAGVVAGMAVIGFVGGSHCAQGHGNRLLDHGAKSILGHWREVPNALLALN